MTTATTPASALGSPLTLTLSEAGSGRPALILHGGGGPLTVAGIARHLSATMHTLIPTHPGWNGTERPAEIDSIEDLALMYLDFLKLRGLSDVVVIGSSLGGWIGVEMALRDEAGRIGELILINAVGVDIVSEPIRDFFALSAREVAESSFHDAERFYVDPATLPPAQIAMRGANTATMRVVAGQPYMHNPDLLDQLKDVRLPVLVLWGESDQIVTLAYGKAYARAFPNARFEIIEKAGHLPQIERPEATFGALDAYLAKLT